jgi:glycine betaine/choline ABC-type transport system substrate-binding protein
MDSRLKTITLMIYEIVFICLWIAAIIPEGISFLEFWRSPFRFMVINEYSIALTIALFLPLVSKHITKLKFFGTEIEVRREFENVREEVYQVKKNVTEQRYDYDRALFSIILSLNRELHTKLRRETQDLKQLPLAIGALDFAESWIIQEILIRKLALGKTPVRESELAETTLMTFFNLIYGKIDLFIWYSGTGMAMAGLEVVPHDEHTGLDILNSYYINLGLRWLPSIGFQALEGPVMLKEKAEKRNIKTMSDLAAQANLLTLGANPEYFLRHWAYPRLKRKGMKFQAYEEVSINNRFSGLFTEHFDVGIGYSTDPEANDKRIVFIEYDDEFPPIPQYAMPLCREEIADVVQKTIKDLQITKEQMRKMHFETKKNNYSKLAIKGIAGDFIRGKI